MQNYDTVEPDTLQGVEDQPSRPALNLYDKGYNVIPLQPESKVPQLATWKEYQYKRPPREKVAEWFEGPANTGIITGKTSGLMVVDLDSQEAINWYWKGFNDLPDITPIVETSRGIHIYYKLPKDLPEFSKIQPRENVEIMGGSHYIVAPPSIHPSGKQYKWLNSPDLGLSEPPEWLIQQVEMKVHIQREDWETSSNDPRDSSEDKIEVNVSDLEAPKVHEEAGERDDIFNHEAFNGPAKSTSTNGRYLTLAITAMNLGLDQRETIKVVRTKYPELSQSTVEDSISAVYKNEYGLSVWRMVDLGIPRPQAIDLLSEVVSRTEWRSNQSKGIQQSKREFSERIFRATLGLTLAGARESTYGELAELAGVSRSTLAHKDSEDLPDLIKIEAVNGQGVKITNYFPLYLTILLNVLSQVSTSTTTKQDTYATPLCSNGVTSSSSSGSLKSRKGETLKVEEMVTGKRGPP